MDNNIREIKPSFETGEEYASYVRAQVEQGANYDELADTAVNILAMLNSFNSTYVNKEGRLNIADFIETYSITLGMKTLFFESDEGRAFHLVAVPEHSRLNLDDLSRAVAGDENVEIPKMKVVHAHTDVVPGLEDKGIRMDMDNGLVSGRGSNDMLAQVALLMVNMALNPDSDLVYYFSGDEEINMIFNGPEILEKFHGFLIDLEPTGNVYGEIITKASNTTVYSRFIDGSIPIFAKLVDKLNDLGVRYQLDEEGMLVVIGDDGKPDLQELMDEYQIKGRLEEGMKIENDSLTNRFLRELLQQVYGERRILEGSMATSFFVDGGLDYFHSLAFRMKRNGIVVSFPEIGGRHTDYESGFFQHYSLLLHFLDLLSKDENLDQIISIEA